MKVNEELIPVEFDDNELQTFADAAEILNELLDLMAVNHCGEITSDGASIKWSQLVDVYHFIDNAAEGYNVFAKVDED